MDHLVDLYTESLSKLDENLLAYFSLTLVFNQSFDQPLVGAQSFAFPFLEFVEFCRVCRGQLDAVSHQRIHHDNTEEMLFYPYEYNVTPPVRDNYSIEASLEKIQ